MPKPGDRPYKDKTIAELVHLFNDKCLAAKSLGHAGASTRFDKGDKGGEALPSTFLKDPASDAEIEAFDRKIRGDPYNFTEGLPSDYVEFLRITNGIYAYDRAADNDEIFRPISEVELDEGSSLDMELVPIYDIGVEDVEIEWPEMEWGIQLGAGGDEGLHCIAPPASVAKAIEVFDQAYMGASKADKKKIEDAVKKIYGSMSNLRKTRCVIIRAYHWAGEIECFVSFKHLLEDFVQSMDAADSEDEADKEGKAGDDDNDDDDDHGSHSEDDGKPIPEKRKRIPDGKANALKGLKLLFTGTFDTMDRDTCGATVKKYGGEVTTKLEDCSYVILGVNPGPKKIETIKSENLTTIDEEGFLQLLKGETPRETQGDLQSRDSKTLPAKKSGDARKEVSEGKREALRGLKFLFTGTMETMDRATAKKTAEKYGAKVITKLEDTDYVVIGTNAGPKKIQEIEKQGLKTLSEQEFLDMLQTGSTDSDSGRDREKADQGATAPGKRTEDGNTSTENRTSKRLRKV